MVAFLCDQRVWEGPVFTNARHQQGLTLVTVSPPAATLHRNLWDHKPEHWAETLGRMKAKHTCGWLPFPLSP